MKSLSSLLQVASSLLVPVAIGMSAFILLCGLVDGGIIQNELFYRYMMGHWVNRTTSALFCIGGAALLMAFRNLLGQFASIRRVDPGNLEVDAESETDASLSGKLLEQLKRLSPSLHEHYLFQRLKNLFEHIARNGASDATENELRHLGEVDLDRKQARYSFVRILIWAIPLLGFLGTVLGISEALGKLSVGASEDLPKMISGLQASLYVAFDTTAQALVLSIGLMFALYFCDRIESQLLHVVDNRALELTSRYFEFTTPANEAATQVSRLGRRMLAATRTAVKEQTEIWRSTIGAAEQAWSVAHQVAGEDVRLKVVAELENSVGRLCHELRESVAETLDKTTQSAERIQNQSDTLVTDSLNKLSEAIRGSLEKLESMVAVAADRSTDSLSDHLVLWQSELQRSNGQFADQALRLQDQATVLLEFGGRLESLVSLQDALNRSLDALTSTSRMEFALTELTQVIQALRADLHESRHDSKTQKLASGNATVPIRILESSKRAA